MSNPAPGASSRPLPTRPSLELERKHAKALLKQLRAREPDALARARDTLGTLRRSAAAPFKLADAQLIIAREYGFLSWPRLVQYFGDVSRILPRSLGNTHETGFYEHEASALITHHRDRRTLAGRTLAASVPRFYGLTLDEVFASTIDEADARLAIARRNGFPSWDALVEAAAIERARLADPWNTLIGPQRDANTFIARGDLEALQRLIAEHPTLIDSTRQPSTEEWSLAGTALFTEERRTVEKASESAMRERSTLAEAGAITDWVASQGVDIALLASKSLCTRMFRGADEVRFFLSRGADPNWTAANGFSVLEHALLIYWNGAAVDLLAERANAPRALWVAAGLGDVDGVSQFFDRHGNLTADARRDRPDFGALPGPMQSLLRHPVPDDIDVLAEAFFIALTNGRVPVLDYLLDRGFPIDYAGWEMPFASFAAGNRLLPAFECLVRRGANLDQLGRHPDISARGMARQMFENQPDNPIAARIFELSGGDPKRGRAELAARPVPDTSFHPWVQTALELAGDDAARLGQKEIAPPNLLVAVLRMGSEMMSILSSAGVDLQRLREEIGARILPAGERAARDKLQLDAAAAKAVEHAIAFAKETNQGFVIVSHILNGVAESGDASLRDLLVRCGSSLERLSKRLQATRLSELP